MKTGGEGSARVKGRVFLGWLRDCHLSSKKCASWVS
jgi:hypothetical protein